MSFDLAYIYDHMGAFALAIAGTLVLMALAASAVFLERIFVFSRSRRASRAYSSEARKWLEQGALDRLVSAATVHRHSHLADLLATGTATFVSASGRIPADTAKVTPVELARRELDRKVELVNAELRRGMNVLASVGSVAPFVGLLGTVVGIITCFEGISMEGSGGLGAVSAGIAEALVVAALGLLVAIPAVLGFNYLSSQVDGLALALDTAKGQLVDALESRPEVTANVVALRDGGQDAQAAA